MSGEGTYAPKSPDLSSFFSAPGPTQPPVQSKQSPTGQAQPHPGSYQTALSQNAFLQQQPPDYYGRPVSAGTSSQPAPQIRGQSHPQLLPPHSPANAAYSQLSSHSPHHQYPQSVTQAGAQPVRQAFPPQGLGEAQAGYGLQAPTAYPNYYQPYRDGQYQQEDSASGFAQQQLYAGSASLAGHIPHHPESQQLQPQSQSQSQSQPQPQPQPQSDSMPPRRSAASSSSQQPAAIEPSPVKTKFPTARIKRIMQADEEVGKVAQQTPIAVGKALEMFMIHLVTKSAEVAKEKSSKRVTAAMLKQVVESDEQWDFLREIVSKVDVEDKAGKAGGKPKAESESEEEPAEKKKGKGGRKKKA